MALSLTEFEKETESSLREFVKDYQQKHKENPEQYPLVLPDGQEGLWIEFFLVFDHEKDGEE